MSLRDGPLWNYGGELVGLSFDAVSHESAIDVAGKFCPLMKLTNHRESDSVFQIFCPIPLRACS